MPSIFKKAFSIAVFAKVALVFSLVAAVSVAASNKMVIAVSYAPYAYIVDAIGGDKVEVVTLLPSGTDLDKYVPKADELKEFSRADVYFTDGSGRDAAWFSRFKELKKSIRVVDISSGVVWRNFGAPAFDPNIWTSPKQMAKLASSVRVALSEIMPEHTDFFVVKLSRILQRLNRSDEDLRKTVLKLPENLRAVVVPYPRYGFFAQDYGVKQLPVDISWNAPTAKDVESIIETGRKNGARVVIVTPQFSQEAIAKIKKELDAKVVVQELLCYNFNENAKAITAAFNEIAEERLKKALSDPTMNPRLKKK